MLAVSTGETSMKDIFKWLCLHFLVTQRTSPEKTIIYMKFLPDRYNNMKNIKFWLFKGVKNKKNGCFFKKNIRRSIYLDNL